MDDAHSQHYDDLLFGVRRSVRYHRRREAHYQRCHGWTMWAVLVCGSSSLAALGGAATVPPWLHLAPAALATLLAALGSVVGYSGRAARHLFLAREFGAMERRLVTEERSPALLAEVTGQRLAVEAQEPPILRVLGHPVS